MKDKLAKTIILVGSNSIHTQRFLMGIGGLFNTVVFITNHINNTQLSVNTIPYLINFKLSNLRASFLIGKIIRQYAGAIVHIHQANSYAYHTLKAIRTAKLNCKTILSTWGSDILLLPQQNPLLKRMVKFNLANSDIVTSDSLYMSAQIKQLCPAVKELHTINFGMQHFPPTSDLSYKQDIILSNRLHKPLYNIDKIIDNYVQFIRQNPVYSQYKLIIAASGTETPALSIKAQNSGISPEQIVFSGMLSYEQLAAWYKRAKLFISIPDSDAGSLSLLEAMGYGCYPLLSNLPANLEWVIDGINGIINQNSTTLYLDMKRALDLITDKARYSAIAKFNHSLIQQKAVFEDNIKKFAALYATPSFIPV